MSSRSQILNMFPLQEAVQGESDEEQSPKARFLLEKLNVSGLETSDTGQDLKAYKYFCLDCEGKTIMFVSVSSIIVVTRDATICKGEEESVDVNLLLVILFFYSDSF